MTLFALSIGLGVSDKGKHDAACMCCSAAGFDDYRCVQHGRHVFQIMVRLSVAIVCFGLTVSMCFAMVRCRTDGGLNISL